MRWTAVKIQATARAKMSHRHVAQLRQVQAVSKLQSFYHGCKARCAARRRIRAILMIQRCSSSSLFRCHLQRRLQLLKHFQSWFIRTTMQRAERCRCAAAERMQALARGRQGRCEVRQLRLALLRRRRAARHLLRCWRSRMHLRIRSRLGLLFEDIMQGQTAVEVPPVGSIGELVAACAMLRRRIGDSEREFFSLSPRHALLSKEYEDLRAWPSFSSLFDLRNLPGFRMCCSNENGQQEIRERPGSPVGLAVPLSM